MKKRICKNICIMLLSVFLLNGCKTEPVEENDATEYSEAIYTCEVVEDITQEEIVCFDNLLLYYGMTRNWNNDEDIIGYIYEYIFVFKGGSVYVGKEYFLSNEVMHYFMNCDDAGWSNLEEVYYLGNFSGKELAKIYRLLESVDYDSEIIDYHEPTPVPCSEGFSDLNQRDWNSMGCRIIYENEEGDMEVFGVEGRGLYDGQEKLGYQTTDQNALALMDFVEESPFYTTWLELIFEETE